MASSGALLLDRLSALQNRVKRDPAAYADEFALQAAAFAAELAALSVHELDERISQLRDEIRRLESARDAKQASRQAAEGVFKL